MKGPILCFVGPPGVGKTSLGQSIARSMNRKFVRISLGGVRDEAEIRGHRRTYIGSMPGRLVQALKSAGSSNPVLMLDEIDKISVGVQGDPAAALLEVLDPAQNHAFRDHYLEIPIDLSRVLFIATANQLGTIHPALLDRMELISLSGYTEDDKVHIARMYLIPRQVEEHGLTPDQLTITDSALRRVIIEYTREAGVRTLERQIGTIARKVAARVATDSSHTATVDAAQVPEYLGPPRYRSETAFRTSRPGVATGVAWTESGGDVLFIEAVLLPGGNGHLTLTGQLGSVMQESARAALSHVRQQARALGIAPEILTKHDLHVHVPAGAIPKDGPSAGVTIATAIVSAARDVPVNSDVAMTGEITLSGLVLPVGGIREKALAARRYGVRTFILPEMNEQDLAELPEEVRREMTFVPARTLEEVLKVALPGVAGADAAGADAGADAAAQTPRLPTAPSPDRAVASVFFYISGHGFGHVSREIEVVNALAAARPDLSIVIRTAAARRLFDQTVRHPFVFIDGACDTGVVQIDSLRLDEDATIRHAAEFHRRLPELAARGSRPPARARRPVRRGRHGAARAGRGRRRRRPVRRPGELHLGLDLRGLPRSAGGRTGSDPHPAGRVPACRRGVAPAAARGVHDVRPSGRSAVHRASRDARPGRRAAAAPVAGGDAARARVVRRLRPARFRSAPSRLSRRLGDRDHREPSRGRAP